MTLWTQSGKIITDDQGNLILCDHCPCWEKYTGDFSVRAIPVVRYVQYELPINVATPDELPVFRTLGVTTTTGISSPDRFSAYGGFYGDSQPLVCDPYVEPPSTWSADLTSAVTGGNSQIAEADWSLDIEQGSNYYVVNGQFSDQSGISASRYGSRVSHGNRGLALYPGAITDPTGKDRELEAVKLKIELRVDTTGCEFYSSFEIALEVADSDSKDDLIKVMKILPWQFGELPGLRVVPCSDPEAAGSRWLDVAYQSIDPCYYPALTTVNVAATCTGVKWGKPVAVNS